MDIIKVNECISNGLSLRETANELGYNKSSLFSFTKSNGLQFKCKSGRKEGFKHSDEFIKSVKISSTKHGMWGTKFYKMFYSINQRCNNLKNKEYNSYGGRGIKCEWNSFEEFKQDMYMLYVSKLESISEKDISIERIDNDLNYCKYNCTFIPLKLQGKNQQRHKSDMYQSYLKYKFDGGDLNYRQYWYRYTKGLI